MAAASATSEGPSDPTRALRDGSSDKLCDDPDADIILRSADSQEFRVLKLYINRCSPVLKELTQAVASNPRDATILPEAESTLPVVKMPESGSILSGLLSFIFPMSPALPETAEATMELLSVAQKYKMSSVLNHIRGTISLQDPPFIHKENAFHIYSLAQKHSLHQEAAQAARITLKFALTIEDLRDELHIMSGAYLYELWRYHLGVQSNISSQTLDFRTSNAYDTLAGQSCVSLTATPGVIPKWLDDYICSIATAPYFFDFPKFHTAMADHIYKTRCPGCAHMPSEKIDAFWSALTDVFYWSMETVSAFDINGVA
jgi:BTB/POZ domain